MVDPRFDTPMSMIEGVVSCAVLILGASENIPMTDRLCAAMYVQWVTILVMSVQYAYACLIMDGYKTGESRNTMHVANCKGLFITLYAHQRSEDWNTTEMLEMLRELWPGMPDSALEESRKARFEHGLIDTVFIHSTLELKWP